MKQLLEKKQGTRAIVFALLLTMMAWLAPANVGIAKAATMKNGSAVKVGKPLYKQCAGRVYESKYKSGKEGVVVKFGNASKGKITLYLGRFTWDTGDSYGTKPFTGTAKGKKVKFKTSKWYGVADDGSPHHWKNKISGTITIVNKNTIKLKTKSGKEGPLLKPGKTVTLRYDANAVADNFEYLY